MIKEGTRKILLSGFFPLGGTPPPPTPLTENHVAKKSSTAMGGAEKIRKVVFCRFQDIQDAMLK